MTNKTGDNLPFSEQLKALSLEQLRDKEAFFVEEILRHYDELEDIENDQSATFKTINNSLNRDFVRLDAIRFAAEYKLKSDLLNTGNAIFVNLFSDAPVDKFCNFCGQTGFHSMNCEMYEDISFCSECQSRLISWGELVHLETCSYYKQPNYEHTEFCSLQCSENCLCGCHK